MGAVAMPAISSFALALSFFTVAAEKVKKASGTGGSSNRWRRCCSLPNGKGIGTGLVSTNHLPCTGAGADTPLMLPRWISDHALKNSQKEVPSPTEWFMDTATKTPSASSVSCAHSTGSDSTAESALSTRFIEKNSQTTFDGLYTEPTTSLTATPGAAA
jgi:hypothetical protein